MNQQQALIKLAQVRLAINYVLRHRGLEKRAILEHYPNTPTLPDGPEGRQRAFENDIIRNNKFSYGADPDSMTPEERQEFLGFQVENGVPYWEKEDYYKPEFEYINRIPRVQDASIYGPYFDEAWHAPIRFNEDGTLKAVPGNVDMSKLSHGASLPKWHPSYINPTQLNETLSDYYTNIYNGNRTPYRANMSITNENGTGSSSIVDFGLPVYPVEGIKPMNSSTLFDIRDSNERAEAAQDFWNSATKRQKLNTNFK